MGEGMTRDGAFERKDVNPTAIYIFLGALFLAVVFSLVFLWWLYGAFGVRMPLAAPAKLTQVPPEPRIQARPQVEIYRLRQHEDSVLGSYGWVDQPGGVARIPISRAMEILSERGLPTQAAQPATAPDTGPESGGPQTGAPVPRLNRPPGLEPSKPLKGAPQ